MSLRTSASSGGGGGCGSIAASSADPLPADPLAAGGAIDELLATNDCPNSCKKCQYPEPGFAVERSGPVGGQGSYTNSFKAKAAAFTRVLCADGNQVGNTGAAKVLGVNEKRIISWVKEENKLRGLLKKTPKLSKAESLHAGAAASTVDIDQALEDYINERRKQHHGCGRHDVMNKLLELKPDAFGDVSATATPQEAEDFKNKFNSWYQRLRRRRGLGIRRGTNVGQKLPNRHEGMAWATLMTLREALVERAGEIYTDRNPCAPGDSPIKGNDLTSEQLESVTAKVFQGLGNIDQARRSSSRRQWRQLWSAVRKLLA